MNRSILSMICFSLSLTAACVAQPPTESEGGSEDDTGASAARVTCSDGSACEGSDDACAAACSASSDAPEATDGLDIKGSPALDVSEEALAQRVAEMQVKYPKPVQASSPSALPPPCPADGRVAFSVTGNAHVSQGGSTLLGYNSNIFTNVGGGWPNVINSSTFTAPCLGLYTFAVSFVKDAYYNGGTADDVYVTIKKNGVSMGRAWSGEGGGSRSTGAYTVTMLLKPGDIVFTVADSDGGPKRHLGEYNFTGFFVK